MTLNCDECGKVYSSKRALERHWRREHKGELELETPEENLPDDDSEQRDFEGKRPSTYQHNPEVIGEENDPPETEATGLDEFAEGDDE